MSVITAPPITNRPPSPPSRRRRPLILAAVMTVVAVSAGVVVTRSTGDPDSPSRVATSRANPAAVTTLAQTLTELEAAAARRPDDPRNWQQLAQGYVQRSIQSLDPAYYPLAQKALAKATQLAPDDPATVVASASLAVTQHQFATARDLATRTISLNPDGPQAYSILVDAEIELGRYDEAAAALQDLLDRRPGAAPLARVAYLRELHGDLPGATEAMRDAESASAGDTAFERATYTTLRADLLLTQGQLDAAAPLFRRALQLVPELPLAVIGTARIEAARGELDPAIDRLATLVKHAPVPAAATLLGDLQQLDGQSAEASDSFALVRALIELQQAGGVDADLDLTLFEADYGTPTDDSIAQARRAFTDRPSVYGADALAWTLYRAGRAAEARPLLDQSLRLGTVDSQLRYHAAAILDATGDPTGARSQLQQAVNLNPWFSFSLQAEARQLAGKLGVSWPVAS